MIAGQILRDLEAFEDDQRFVGTAAEKLSANHRKHLYLSCILARLSPSEAGIAQTNEDMDADERLSLRRDQS